MYRGVHHHNNLHTRIMSDINDVAKRSDFHTLVTKQQQQQLQLWIQLFCGSFCGGPGTHVCLSACLLIIIYLSKDFHILACFWSNFYELSCTSDSSRAWQLMWEIREFDSCWEKSKSLAAAERDQRAGQLLWDQRARVQELLGLENAVGDRCSWDLELCWEIFCSESCVYLG